MLTLAALPAAVLFVDLVYVCAADITTPRSITTMVKCCGVACCRGVLVRALILRNGDALTAIGHCRSLISGSQESGNAAGGTDEVQCQLATCI